MNLKNQATFARLRRNFFETYAPLLLTGWMEGKEWFLCEPIRVIDNERFLIYLTQMGEEGIVEVRNKSVFSKAIYRCFKIGMSFETFYQKVREHWGLKKK